MRGWLSKPGDNWWRGEAGVKAVYRVLILIGLYVLIECFFGWLNKVGIIPQHASIPYPLRVPKNATAYQMSMDVRYFLSAFITFFAEILQFFDVVIPLLIVAWFEGKSIWSCFLNRKKHFRFFLFGFLCAGFLRIFAYFSYKFPHCISYEDRISAAVMIFFACCLIGFSEELMFRGYIQKTFESSMGFWSALVVSSLLFGVFHVSNLSFFAIIHHPFLTSSYVFSISCFGVLLCVGLRQMGTLWWPIGFHVAWDFVSKYMQVSGNYNSTLPLHLVAGTHRVSGALSPTIVISVGFVLFGLFFLVLAALLMLVKRAPRAALVQNAT